MTEEGTQERQPTLRVLLRTIPVNQGLRGKPVPQVVEARPFAVVESAQAGPPRGAVEGPMNRSDIQPVAPARNEQVRGDSSSRPVPCAPIEILGQHFAGRGVQ